MSPKTVNKSGEKTGEKMAPAKKDPAKKATKASPPGKVEKKLAREDEEETSEQAEAPTPLDLEELEEAEDERAESSSAGGNAAALAAAAGSNTEMSASFKNFRHHPDMENFYRFIYENDLRHEALAIIDEIMADKLEKRLGKAPK